MDLSFQRVFERKVRNCEGVHDMEKCGRCRQDAQNDLYTKNLVVVKPPIVSTYGVILVESPNGQDSKTVTRHDLCLFVVENSTFLEEEEEALPLVVEDILQTDMLYHTITHAPFKDPPDGTRDLVWNLPLPYRPPTEEQRTDVKNWCQELLGQPITKTDRRKDNTDTWSHLQMLLHFLRLGSSYLDANSAVTQFCQKFPDILKEENEARKKTVFTQFVNLNRSVGLGDFFAWIDRENGQKEYFREWEPLFPPSKLQLKGDIGRKLALTNGKILEVAPT
jgi:hypothetical protein